VTATPATGIQQRALRWPVQGYQALRAAAGRNRWFTIALAGGALMRLITMIGFPGALWFAGDSYVYLGAALRPQPNLSKTTGYSLFLRLLLPFHSLTLVTLCQHLMGLGDAVMIYALLRRSGVSKKWSTIATLPVLYDGFMIEDEHLIMTEALFTFCVVLALLLVLRYRRMPWWTALIAGLLVGYAAIVRTEGVPFLAVFPVFLLVRGWRADGGWKQARAWIAAIAMALGCAAPVLGYALWFQSYSGSFNLTLSDGYYLWGRVSSFANCAVIKPTGQQAAVCPKEPLKDRTAPGNFIWHAPEVHQDLPGGPVTAANNSLLTSFAIHAVEAQPVGYVKAVAHGLVLSVEPTRKDYPGAGTVYYYYFHRHPIALPDGPEQWIKGGVPATDWVAYGHAQAGVVHEPFAAFMIAYQRVFWTWGPLFGIIMVMGLGGWFQVRPVRGWRLRRGELPVYWAPRGTSMFPWVVAVLMLLTPLATADFDYRYLLPVLPFGCLAAGLALAPGRVRAVPAGASEPAAASSLGADADPGGEPGPGLTSCIKAPVETFMPN
jgi:4-amino-4-deoxy-L-arabinose transferase-like glycosyltransferase